MSSGVEGAMIKARNAEKRGDFPEAERLYASILQRFPRNARAQRGLDQLHGNRAQAVMKAHAPPQPELDRLAALYREGRLAQLTAAAEDLLGRYARSAIVYNLLGAAWLGLGRPEQAEEVLRRALAQDIRHPALCNNLGMALAELGRHEEATAAYGEAIELNPRYATARNNLGNALKQLGRLQEAVESYEAAIALEPDYADAYNNMGLVLADLGRHDEARDAYAKALALAPNHAAACNNLGNLLTNGGDLPGAIAQFERAIAIDGAYADAHFNLGNAYRRQGRIADAERAYERARAADPAHAESWVEQGKALAMEGHLDDALAAFDEALALEPGHAAARSHRQFYRAHVCNWTAFAEFEGNDESTDSAIQPFAMLTFEDDPARQLRRSRAWAGTALPQAIQRLPAHAASGDGRIRLGYFSADFHDHATMHLIAGLIREHDRKRFAVHAYSFGSDHDDAMRRQLREGVETFTDIAGLTDAEAVDLARSHQIDIAVDLKGYTQGARPQLFARRLAPLQVSFLGYPGSMGTDCIDYLIADPVVVPEAERAHYSEKLLLLPDSYQANDDRRPVAESTTTRADFGLPEDAFVFCCFNQNYKISPREFAIWMRLLQNVEGSVLWLLRSNEWAQANLLREAAAHGVDPARLVFAANLPHAEHLGRLKHADLFLDTFNVNAHTTASDALWAGLPVLTKAGRQFAARVCASLLSAVGLPDLVTTSEHAYEALCRDLANDRARLSAMRDRLAANRVSEPLFDTARFARAIEAGYRAAWERHAAGLPPADLAIAG